MGIDRRAVIDELQAAVARHRRHPRHAISLALILAVGIGGTVGIFHVAYRVLRRPLPYPNADRTVVLPAVDGAGLLISGYRPYPPNPELHTAFVSAAWYFYDSARVNFDSQPKKMIIALVTPHFFSTLGVQPVIGRAWSSKFRPPYPPTPGGTTWLPMVLSFHLWKTYFGADRRVIGMGLQTFGMNGRRYEIVGVAPRGMSFPPGADAWAPAGIYSVSLYQSRNPAFSSSGVVGLLQPGLSIQSAEARVAAWPTRRDPSWYYPRGQTHLLPIRSFLAGEVPQLARVLWLSTLLLLFLATLAAIGVAGAGIERRRSELEIKSMLGATANRLGLSLGVELGLVLLIALAASYAVRNLLVAVTARYFRLSLSGALEWREVAMALAPAAIVLMAVLARQRRALAAAGSARGLRRGFPISAQWIVTTTILVAACLLAQSGFRLLHVNLGLNPHHVYVAEVSLPTRQSSFFSVGIKKSMPQAERERVQRQDALAYNAALVASYSGLIQRLRGSALVGHVGVISTSPYSGYAPWMLGGIKFRSVPTACSSGGRSLPLFAAARSLSSGAFGALGMTIQYGNEFAPVDDTVRNPVVVINDALARHFGGKAALGGYLCFGPLTRRGYRIIGVVRNVRETSVLSRPVPTVYYPLSVSPQRTMDVVTRTSKGASGGDVLDLIRAAAASVSPGAAISNFDSMISMVRSAESENIYAAIYLLLLAATSVFLAGVAAWVASAEEAHRRIHEIGIRIALGARFRDVVWLVINAPVKFGVLSVVAGGLLAWWFVRLFSHLFFQTGFSEPLLYVIVMLALVGYLMLVHALSVLRALQHSPAELIAHL